MVKQAREGCVSLRLSLCLCLCVLSVVVVVVVVVVVEEEGGGRRVRDQSNHPVAGSLQRLPHDNWSSTASSGKAND